MNVDLLRVQQYLEWLKTKLYLDSRAFKAQKRVVKRGEVYKCKLGIGIGSEENKERPCVILQADTGNWRSPNTIVAPITHSVSKLPIVVPIADKLDVDGKLLLDGHVLLGNIVTVSKARLGNFIVNLDSKEMEEVDKATSISLDLKRHYDKLKNIHEDKLVYIEKLKLRRNELETELEEKCLQIATFTKLREDLGYKDFAEFEEKIRKQFQIQS